MDWQPDHAPILGVEAVRGRDGVKRFFARDLFEGFDHFRAEPLSFEDFGDTVLVMVRYTWRGGRTDSNSIRPSPLYTLRDGRTTVTMPDYATRDRGPRSRGAGE